MKTLISILFGSLLALSVASTAQADDKKPAKEGAAAPAGKEVKLTGTFGCAKCSFKEADKCQNVFKVKHGAKVTSYELADNAIAKEHHEDICHAPAGKPATVKGTVSEDGGKKIITVSEIKLK